MIFRSESKEHIVASLSKEAILKRRRRNTIGIQITFISWMLEFVAGIAYIARYVMLQRNQDDAWTDRLFAIFDFFVCLILIPGSYLLNDEATKLMIHAQGWISFCRVQIVSIVSRIQR